MLVPILLGCSQNERIAILDCVVPEEVPRDARDLEGHPYSDNLRTQFIWYGAPANGLKGSDGSWTPFERQSEFDAYFKKPKDFGGQKTSIINPETEVQINLFTYEMFLRKSYPDSYLGEWISISRKYFCEVVEEKSALGVFYPVKQLQ